MPALGRQGKRNHVRLAVTNEWQGKISAVVPCPPQAVYGMVPYANGQWPNHVCAAWDSFKIASLHGSSSALVMRALLHLLLKVNSCLHTTRPATML